MKIKCVLRFEICLHAFHSSSFLSRVSFFSITFCHSLGENNGYKIYILNSRKGKTNQQKKINENHQSRRSQRYHTNAFVDKRIYVCFVEKRTILSQGHRYLLKSFFSQHGRPFFHGMGRVQIYTILHGLNLAAEA